MEVDAAKLKTETMGEVEEETPEGNNSFITGHIPNATFANMHGGSTCGMHMQQEGTVTNSTNAIPDTGCNRHTGNLQTPGINKRKTLFGPHARVPNGMIMQALHELNLPIPSSSSAATHTNIYPEKEWHSFTHWPIL
eukprot:5458915-Ditylum_brightwellii.AAC.1